MTNEFKTSNRRAKFRVFLLTVPLLLFVFVFFGVPIITILINGFYNPKVVNLIPETLEKLESYDYKQGIPDEGVIKTFLFELKDLGARQEIGPLGEDLNRRSSGMSSLMKRTGRMLRRVDLNEIEGSYQDYLFEIDERWGNVEYWNTIKQASNPFTIFYFLNALDMEFNSDGEIVFRPEDQRIYVPILLRTFYMALLITVLTVILGYPTSYYLSVLPKSKANLMMLFVLLPFWTSLLVRIVAWITMLQDTGVINQTLTFLGIIDEPLPISFNAFATVVAMTHILLPFMVLPLYGSMRSMDRGYLRASSSMGAPPIVTFIKVYFPLTLAGLSAGCILVFIISIGYYITPALVGGVDGQMISNLIEFHMRKSGNWELASAMGAGLLFITIVLYWIYDRLVGINNLTLN